MIAVAGNQLDINIILPDYEENGVEAQVLKTMDRSRENYRYDNLDQLRFELRLRRETVKAARDLNSSGMHFVVFHKSFCNEEYWRRTENGGFRLKSGAEPAKAINDIFENGRKYGTECATAMVIVYLRAILKTFGPELFNARFTDIYLMNWHDLHPLIREIGMPRRVEDKLLGDRAYFANPDVDPKTPELQGENVIVLPGGLYYGHGMGIQTADWIIRALNANRREGATREAYFMDSVSRPNYKRLASIYHEYAARPASYTWRIVPARA